MKRRTKLSETKQSKKIKNVENNDKKVLNSVPYVIDEDIINKLNNLTSNMPVRDDINLLYKNYEDTTNRINIMESKLSKIIDEILILNDLIKMNSKNADKREIEKESLYIKQIKLIRPPPPIIHK